MEFGENFNQGYTSARHQKVVRVLAGSLSLVVSSAV